MIDSIVLNPKCETYLSGLVFITDNIWIYYWIRGSKHTDERDIGNCSSVLSKHCSTILPSPPSAFLVRTRVAEFISLFLLLIVTAKVAFQTAMKSCLTLRWNSFPIKELKLADIQSIQ